MSRTAREVRGELAAGAGEHALGACPRVRARRSGAMGYAAAVFSTAVGALATLGLLVLFLASMPNSTDAQLTTAKRWMLVIAVGGLAAVAGAAWLAVHGRPWTGAVVGGVPAAGMIGLFIWIEATRG